MTSLPVPRRGFLIGSALAAAAALPAGRAAALHDVPGDDFPYEVRRTEQEWRARLSDPEYNSLRLALTEPPKSSPLWDETRPGAYACKGCDLPLYDGSWKVVLEIGWAFFAQSHPNALLMGIDMPANDGTASAEDLRRLARIEVHCRRCGSHHGHVVAIGGQVLHCINGVGLRFAPQPA